MTIVVAGATGLAGSAIVRAYEKAGKEVIGINRSVCDLLDRDATIDFIKKAKPDLVVDAAAKVGGIGEFRRIAAMADEYAIRVIPHGWNTAIGLAVDLQLSSAILTAEKVEYCTGSAYVDDLATEPWKLDKYGLLEIPTKPGIGFELDPDKVEKYSGVRGFLD